ncbi:hypothetical protein GQR42_15795 [Microcystis aeruginosa FD4]|uniref:Uncharacterized protein n=1 Tax=Microcystis aeruginosa FD4 TaxID=2686288 RepID=A0A857D4J7_MICAE|nr:hypothetical protein GQR42_15795 [Microcystis aeruginosa FD4]
MSDQRKNKSDPKTKPRHLNIEQRNLLYQLSQEGNLSQRQVSETRPKNAKQPFNRQFRLELAVLFLT